jgi:hypothetical protein
MNAEDEAKRMLARINCPAEGWVVFYLAEPATTRSLPR